MEMKKKQIHSATAVGALLGVFIFAFWFLCMSILTLGTSQYEMSSLCDSGIDYAKCIAMVWLENWYSSDEEYENLRRTSGALEYYMNSAIAHRSYTKLFTSPPIFDSHPPAEDTSGVFYDTNIIYDTAIVILDKSGNIFRESGDFIYFGYIPQDQWESGKDETSAFGWIDIDDDTDPRYDTFRSLYTGTSELYDLHTIRITGYMDGSRIEPLSMAFLTEGMYYHARDAAGPVRDLLHEPEESEMTISRDEKTSAASGGKNTTAAFGSDGGIDGHYSASELDAMGLLEWDVRFDNTKQADAAQECVTIYARCPNMMIYEPDGPVRYQSETYENLLESLKTTGYYQESGSTFYSSDPQLDLWSAIVFDSYGIYDLRSYDPASGEPFPDPEYTIVTAVQASPLKMAMTFLRDAYLITFAAALAGFLYIRRRVRRLLITPLQIINEGIAANWAPVVNENAPTWKEPKELWEHYFRTQDTLRKNRNEIKRLNTALKYAEAAEQNRRRMTSDIAHELKTPLAVIHSYAEGLKEHIAEEKRDKYIDVILSEVTRTDRMVLEMLDLSRLEAGKVKLSRDDFSLLALTRAVFEKQEMAARAKKLKIRFDFPDDFTVTADEGRIAQVIENFATNAVKYTPAGGNILVKIQTAPSGVTFRVENDCEPLSDEALNKVWDTFYRTDEARGGGGTGLGLAIAKNIVELHGGKYSVCNTKTGVAFGFTVRQR